MSRADRRRSLGKVVSVTADRFVVELSAGSDSFTLVGFDGQHYVARVGSFVLIPLQTEYVVAEVVGLRERELSGSEQIETDIEDTHALRAVKFLDVVPVGSLPFRKADSFKFGVSVYPPLYSDAIYTQTTDLDRVFEVSDADELVQELDNTKPTPTQLKAFSIGSSVIFDDYQVKVSIDEFFGGHCAILGNTGSGKSCTVAAILQSILAKSDEYAARGASFLLFDTNGEYRQAFKELPAPIGRLYALVPGYDGSGVAPVASDPQETTVAFRLPHWFLSPEEWELLLRASDKTQKPILRNALGLTSLFATSDDVLRSVKNHVLASAIQSILTSSESETASAGRIRGLVLSFHTPELSMATLGSFLTITFGEMKQIAKLHEILQEYISDDISLPDYQNEPFVFETLQSALDLAILYEESHGNKRIRDYCSSLLTRLKSIHDRKEYEFLRPDPGTLKPHETDIRTFVELLLGLEKREGVTGYEKKTQLSILDMNEVEDEIVEVVSAVITRLIFERLRRADDRNAFPVNLVLEEAHRYVAERPSDFALDAIKIFKRVAKEGRKYGLFIMLASQRPSELSRTILSQCSNFVVHRIQNPEDLQHVRRMTPFISESVLSRMPSLPKQHALIFGNSVSVPTTFKVREASPKPKSENARIRHVWFVDDASITDL